MATYAGDEGSFVDAVVVLGAARTTTLRATATKTKSEKATLT